jgi:hypothetical protein
MGASLHLVHAPSEGHVKPKLNKASREDVHGRAAIMLISSHDQFNTVQIRSSCLVWLLFWRGAALSSKRSADKCHKFSFKPLETDFFQIIYIYIYIRFVPHRKHVTS